MTTLRTALRNVSWARFVVSALIVVIGLTTAQALSRVDADIRVMYHEYTLAAVELAHISSDVLRYRATMIRAVEAPSRQEFEAITASLPAERAKIQHAVDRYAAASLRVSRSGRSEPLDLRAVRDSLEAYFSSASTTFKLLIQSWNARSPRQAQELRQQAELHAADNAGPKMIQLSLALDRLLETVTEVALDMRDDGTRVSQRTQLGLVVASVLLAVFNLLVSWPKRLLTAAATTAQEEDDSLHPRPHQGRSSA